MTRKVVIPPDVQAQLDALSPEQQEQLEQALARIAEDPHPDGVTRFRLVDRPDLCPHLRGATTDVVDGICTWCEQPVARA